MIRGLGILLAVCLPWATVQAETLEGRPIIIDGDSIVVAGKPVRLWGIDAPEMATRAGSAAKSYLRTVISHHEVRCEDHGERAGGHIMAQCFLGAVDLGRIMVLSGNAVDWRQRSGGYYGRLNNFGKPEPSALVSDSETQQNR